MLRYVLVYKTINNITVIAQSNYNPLGVIAGLTSSHPEQSSCPPAQMVLQLCGRVCRRSLKTLH
jgi:hypothetical protein